MASSTRDDRDPSTCDILHKTSSLSRSRKSRMSSHVATGDRRLACANVQVVQRSGTFSQTRRKGQEPQKPSKQVVDQT